MLKTKMSKKTMTQTCKEQQDDRKHRSKMLTKKNTHKNRKVAGIKEKSKVDDKEKSKVNDEGNDDNK